MLIRGCTWMRVEAASHLRLRWWSPESKEIDSGTSSSFSSSGSLPLTVTGHPGHHISDPHVTQQHRISWVAFLNGCPDRRPAAEGLSLTAFLYSPRSYAACASLPARVPSDNRAESQHILVKTPPGQAAQVGADVRGGRECRANAEGGGRADWPHSFFEHDTGRETAPPVYIRRQAALVEGAHARGGAQRRRERQDGEPPPSHAHVERWRERERARERASERERERERQRTRGWNRPTEHDLNSFLFSCVFRLARKSKRGVWRN
mmetsp:Transcript_2925/g.10688  ORF Transcript_2925/g.10688 Transcript_2925/m.10688 type:complete len:264 (-) Transcript_2925:334-1125(-)